MNIENFKRENTEEQTQAEKYQKRLEEVKAALAEETEALKPLALSIKDQASSESGFMAAHEAIEKLYAWLQDNVNGLNRLEIKDLKNVRINIAGGSGQKTSSGLPELDIPIMVFPDVDWRNQSAPRDVVRQVFMPAGISSSRRRYFMGRRILLPTMPRLILSLLPD